MQTKGYVSNISPRWKIEEQKEMLAPFVKKDMIFTDDLNNTQRQAHRVVSLDARNELLRPSTRRGSGDLIIMASPAVFAWGPDDFMDALAEAAARNATVRFLDTGLEIGPKAKAPEFSKAAKAFAESRKRIAEIVHGRAGGLKSAKTRSKKDAALSIKQEWALSPEDDGYEETSALLQRAGISNYATAVGPERLKPRPEAQAIRKAELEREAKRIEKNRQKEGARA
jgi:hypothetical protein